MYDRLASHVCAVQTHTPTKQSGLVELETDGEVEYIMAAAIELDECGEGNIMDWLVKKISGVDANDGAEDLRVPRLASAEIQLNKTLMWKDCDAGKHSVSMIGSQQACDTFRGHRESSIADVFVYTFGTDTTTLSHLDAHGSILLFSKMNQVKLNYSLNYAPTANTRIVIITRELIFLTTDISHKG